MRQAGFRVFFSHSRSTTGWLFGADEIGCDLIRGVERPLEIAGSAANVAKTACGPLRAISFSTAEVLKKHHAHPFCLTCSLQPVMEDDKCLHLTELCLYLWPRG